MEVVSVSFGKPQWHIINGVRTSTSIVHEPSSSIFLTLDGIENNAVAAHNAQIYVFFSHHYDYWTEKLGVARNEWGPCHWGENITFKTDPPLNEFDFNIGDIWEVGPGVVLQVCGARVPCNKLSWRCGQKDRWLKELADSGFCGMYMQILQGGTVRPGDRALQIEKKVDTFNVASISRLAFDSSLKTKDTMQLLVEDPNLQAMNKILFRRKLSMMRDRELLKQGAWKGWRELKVSRMADECKGIRSFYLSSVDDQPLATYLPGQFLTVKLPSGLVRNWSISDWPSHEGPAYYRLSIKRDGAASKWMHEECTEGTVLSVRSPAGRFCLDWTPMFPGRQVFISAGIGITPMVAMMKAHLSHPAMQAAPAIWIHVAQDGKHFPFPNEIVDGTSILKRFIFFTRPLETDKPGLDFYISGRPALEHLRDLLQAPYTIDPMKITPIEIPGNISTFYICGPSQFESQIREYLHELSVPDSLVHSEAFAADSGTLLSDIEEASVAFRACGKAAKWRSVNPVSLLELAEEAGLGPDYGCRVGTCGSCKTKLLCGSVTGGIQPDGDVLICSARPASAEVALEL